MGGIVTSTITFGNILEILTIAVGGFAFLWEMRGKLSLLQYSHDDAMKRLEKLDTDFKELAKVTITMATQTQRLDTFERALNETNIHHEQRTKNLDDLKSTLYTKIDNLSNIIGDVNNRLGKLERRRPRATKAL